MKLRFVTKAVQGDAVSFSFAPLEPTVWTAGQSIRLEVPGAYGPEERRFTISSAPSEKVITVTTRVSDSSYKQSLNSLQPGTEVDAFDIRGDFGWDAGELPRVFLASGIGITPFRAILRERITAGQNIPAMLLYASRQPLFVDELRQWQATHPEFRLHLTQDGRMSAALAHRMIPALAHSLIYLSGPSAMVDEVSDQLVKVHHIPESQLKKDWFTGRLARDD